MDKIAKTQVDFENRVKKAIAILKPITKVNIAKVKCYDRDFGCTAHAPESFKTFQKVMRAELVVLEYLQKLL